MLSETSKAGWVAALRLLLGFLLCYAIVGCILYPAWWKEFLFQSGFLQALYWRDGFKQLAGQVRLGAPLGVTMIVVALLALAYVFIRFGQLSSKPPAQRALFFKKLQPSIGLLGVLAVVCLIALLAAFRDEGSYTHFKRGEHMDRLLAEARSLKYWQSSTSHGPPQTGIYIYVNDTQIIRQYQALQSGLELSAITESTKSHTNTSGSISLPLNTGVKVDRSQGSEKATTYKLPEVSATFAVQQLIQRFDKDTNTLKLDALFNDFGFRSERIIRELKERGVELTDEQKAHLQKADEAAFDRFVAQLQMPKVLLCIGDIVLLQTNETYVVELTFSDGPRRMVLTGTLDRKFFTDQLLFVTKDRKPRDELPVIRMYAVAVKKERLPPDVARLEIVPYAIW